MVLYGDDTAFIKNDAQGITQLSVIGSALITNRCRIYSNRWIFEQLNRNQYIHTGVMIPRCRTVERSFQVVLCTESTYKRSANSVKMKCVECSPFIQCIKNQIDTGSYSGMVPWMSRKRFFESIKFILENIKFLYNQYENTSKQFKIKKHPIINER